MMTAKAYL